MTAVVRSKAKHGDAPGPAEALGTFGRYAGPATLILSSLAEGTKHGYALTKDIEAFAGVRLAPGTLYEALSRLGEPGPDRSGRQRRPSSALPAERGGGSRVAGPSRRATPGGRHRAATPGRQLGMT